MISSSRVQFKMSAYRTYRAPDLNAFVDKRVMISLNGRRKVEATLKSFDKFMNLTAEAAQEVQGEDKRDLGLVVIRGHDVIGIEPLEAIIPPRRK
ncbi:hypothetical protein KIPB_006720 [Kipferlia bialata]|uniref:Sm protein G n=1 Tax=Kipferlia bialata TaxID=797122 RepID=A0A9K3CXE5_9EUKA|nr:hypothetical protein KIPB_006720 [Kipferlia bialata]|eukprot:g6720.t1